MHQTEHTLTRSRTYIKKNASHPIDKIPILSFFTGAGFLDLGFNQAGFESIWHNEYNKDFVEGFQFGMSSHGLKGVQASIQSGNSILDVGPREIVRSAFGSGGVPSCFGMIGGPPCPDFSIGGKNRGFQGENGRLTEVYANRILEIRPSFFLLENVPGLIRTSKHRAFLTGVMDRLVEHYHLDLRILNALEFGVPQDRERIFMIGFSKGWLKLKGYRGVRQQNVTALIEQARSAHREVGEVAKVHWFPWESHQVYWNPKATYAWPETGEFGGQPTMPKAPAELMIGSFINNVERLAALPNGADTFVPYSNKFSLIREGDVSKKSFKRLHRWRFSPAAAYGNNEVHLHPFLARRISVREAMMIQTVPDSYSLPRSMPLSAKFKTIGNGVPVKLAFSVAKTIREVMERIEDGSFRPYT